MVYAVVELLSLFRFRIFWLIERNLYFFIFIFVFSSFWWSLVCFLFGVVCFGCFVFVEEYVVVFGGSFFVCFVFRVRLGGSTCRVFIFYVVLCGVGVFV